MKKVMIAVMVAVVLGQGLLSPAAGFVLKDNRYISPSVRV